MQRLLRDRLQEALSISSRGGRHLLTCPLDGADGAGVFTLVSFAFLPL